MGDSAGQPTPDSLDNKPNVLIIGGLAPITGYIGRFLAHHIHSNSLASTLRIVDKQLPQLAQLAPEHVAACSGPNFLQADASKPQSLDRIFSLPNGGTFDYIFNCGGETRYSHDDEVYKARSHALSLNIGAEAARRNCRAYIELSTGQVYEPKREPRKETDKTKPGIKLAQWKLAAEEDLARIPGLNLVVLRLAHVYGPYAGRWLGTQLALARVYQERGKELKYLWGPELRTNTVHVEDVARACWAAATWKAAQNSQPQNSQTTKDASIFNIVDTGATSQGTMASLLASLFNIPTGFQNALVNTFARLNLEYVVDDVNDETLDQWAALQRKAGIADGGSGPLSPFMEKEVLRDAELSLDGGLFVGTVGFR
ncbi:hypothetical protein MBLNU457_7780t2 [Dothideomycetes sp. NU457]